MTTVMTPAMQDWSSIVYRTIYRIAESTAKTTSLMNAVSWLTVGLPNQIHRHCLKEMLKEWSEIS